MWKDVFYKTINSEDFSKIKNYDPTNDISLICEDQTIPAVKAVMWDILGTIIAVDDPNFSLGLSHVDANLFANVAKKLGFWDFVAQHFSNPEEFIKNSINELIVHEHEHKKALGISKPEIIIENIWDEFLSILEQKGFKINFINDEDRKYFCKLCAYKLETYRAIKKLYKNVVTTLIELKQKGVLLGIISNAQFDIPLVLEKFLQTQTNNQISSLYDLFDKDLCIFSYEQGVAKPANEIYSLAKIALAEKGISCAESLMIGNDYINDIKSAKEYGFHTAFFIGDKATIKIGNQSLEEIKTNTDIVLKDHQELLKKLNFDHNRIYSISEYGYKFKVYMFHYHLKPSGVKQVIKNLIDGFSCFNQKYNCNIISYVLCSSSEKPNNLNVKEYVFNPNLEYKDFDDMVTLEQSSLHIKEWIKKCVILDDNTQDYKILWFHNLNLLKNAAFTHAVYSLAQELQEQKNIFIFLHIHDFAEDQREDRLNVLKNLLQNGFKLFYLYPNFNNVFYITINHKTIGYLEKLGIQKTHIFYLPNIINVSGKLNTQKKSDTRIILEDYLTQKGFNFKDHKKILLSPIKCLRRKNILESILLTCLLNHINDDFIFISTLNAHSALDIEYQISIQNFIKKYSIPACIGIMDNLKSIDFEDLVSESSAIIISSVQEGFGMGYLESFLWNKPLIVRYLVEVLDEFEHIGIKFNGAYRSINVNINRFELDIEKLINYYEKKYLNIVNSWTSITFKDLKAQIFNIKIKNINSSLYIDFADLSFDMQIEVFTKMMENNSLKQLMLKENKFLHRLYEYLNKNEDISIHDNQQIIKHKFGYDLFTKRLNALLKDALFFTKTQVQHHDRQIYHENILKEFFNIRRIKALI